MRIRHMASSPAIGGILAALATWLLQALLWVTAALDVSLDWIRTLLPLGMIGLFLVALGVAILEPLDRWRSREKPRPWIAQASIYWALGTLLLLCFANPIRAAWQVEKATLYRAFARRSQPLIEAIRRYEADHGQPPESLEILIPGYLAEIPRSGLAVRDQEFVYRRADDPKGPTLADLDGNPWQLRAWVPIGGFMQFDYIFYYPRQNYPPENGAGVIEVVHGWGYVQE